MIEGARKAAVIEDDPDVRTLLRVALETTGFVVHEAVTGHAGVGLILQEHPDLITLDLVLPGLGGVEVCRRIRAMSDAYIIMITASMDEADRLLALATGADDYVTKPFSPREVQARVAAMFRRPRPGLLTAAAASSPARPQPGPMAYPPVPRHLGSAPGAAPGPAGTGAASLLPDGRQPGTGHWQGEVASRGRPQAPPATPEGRQDIRSMPLPAPGGQGESSDVQPGQTGDSRSGHEGVLRHGLLEVDTEARLAWLAGTELPLTTIEFDLLTAMLGNPRRVWRRETLLDIVWGGQWSDPHVVEVHIGNLRRKLADLATDGAQLIKTVRGIGYRMLPVDQQPLIPVHRSSLTRRL